ncbi:short chain dehydrogenase [Citrobacter freundii]|nr:short chain dehydrogenase [Citrobacter freundii]
MADLKNEKKSIYKTNSVRYPAPPFPQQKQPFPGLAGKMQPRPDHGEESYQGSGRLNGRKVLITGGIQVLAVLLPSPMPVKALMWRSTIYLMKKTMRVKWST